MSNLFPPNDHPEVIVIPATPATESLGGAEAIGRRAKNAIELFSLQEASWGYWGMVFPKRIVCILNQGLVKIGSNFGRNLMVANKPSLIGILCSVVIVVGVVRGHDLADR